MTLTVGTAPFGSAPAGRSDSDPHPPQHESAAMVQGLVAFVRDVMDACFEEDEEVFVHAREPYHRIDVLRSSRHEVVRRGETVVADSACSRMLVETGLPVRWYLPREDVRTDLLEPSCTTTPCPYRGVAQYWTLRDGDREERDVVWSSASYPMHEAEAVEDLLCLFAERLELTVDPPVRG